MALISYSDLQLALGISGEVPLLTTLANGASAAVTTYCQGPDGSFESANRTEYYTGNGSPELVLRFRPVTAVDSIYVSALRDWNSDTLLTANTDYVVDWKRDNFSQTGMVTLLQWPGLYLQAWPLAFGANPAWGGGLTGYGARPIGWPGVTGCIKITYTAGYSSIPDDLKSACIQVGCWMYQSQAFGGLNVGTSYIDVSTTVTAAIDALVGGGVPALGASRQILSRYRDVAYAGS